MQKRTNNEEEEIESNLPLVLSFSQAIITFFIFNKDIW